MFYIESDLNDFIFSYYEALTETDNVNALNQFLNMHINWLTGYGMLPLKVYYSINEKIVMPQNWTDFCDKIKTVS